MPLDIPLPTASPFDDISQYVPLLLSSIEGFLQNRDVWEDADYAEAFGQMEDLKVWIVQNIPPTPEGNLFHFTHWHIGSKVNAGGNVEIVIDTGQIGNHIARQASPTINDETQFKLPLKAGNYTLDVWYRKQSSAAIIDIDIGGIQNVNADLYASSTTQNQLLQQNFTVAADADIVIKTKASGKRAASSGYTVPVTCFVVKMQ